MKLATRKDDSRDGQLVVVSRDLKHAVMADQITGTLQRALDDWAFMAPQLQDLYDALNHGKVANSFPFDPAEYMAPLPRAFQRVEAQAWPSHEKRLQKAGLTSQTGPLPDDMVPLRVAPSHVLLPGHGMVSLRFPLGQPATRPDEDEAGEQEGRRTAEGEAPSGTSAAAKGVPAGTATGAGRTDAPDAAARQAAAAAAAARGGLDFSAQLVAICGDLPIDLEEDDADRHLLLLGLASAWRIHPDSEPVSRERSRDRGLALAPVLITQDELGEDWRDGRIHRPLHCRLNGRSTGRIDCGADMRFGFRQLLAALARQTPVGAGCLLTSGPVSNADPDSGWTSVLEARARRRLENSTQPGPAFLQPGDRIRIDMADARGQSLFGAIEQQTVA